MKKLINDAQDVVDEMLDGIVAATDRLALLEGARVVVRADFEAFRQSGVVALISGGGSGHEPAHAGYVGEGMLSGAVCGDVFTSPSTDAVLAAIRAVTGPAGALLIVKNYTGDRLNFGLAAEIARSEGFKVEMVVVADDVALGVDESRTAGRRGLAGTVLIHKIAGAAAAARLPLEAVRQVAQRAIANIATMGVGLSPCIAPAAGKPNFTLAEDEVELGLGIHGEAGVSREKLTSADALVDLICARIFDALGAVSGGRVALLVNNLGATPAMEMAIVARRAIANAHQRGLKIEAIWIGTFLTAIDMAGCSITVARVDDTTLDALNAPAATLNWVAPQRPAATPSKIALSGADSPPTATGEAYRHSRRSRLILRSIVDALVAAEPHLTQLDQKVGDGDLGHNLARGATAVGTHIDEISVLHPADQLRRLSSILRKTVGGTSGALYAAGLLRAASVLEATGNPAPADWALAFVAASQAIAQIGDAKPGDRTMLDALQPASIAFQSGFVASGQIKHAFGNAVSAAERGTENTATGSARRGRSSYLGERVVGVPDPGAEAVCVWMRALGKALDQMAEGA